MSFITKEFYCSPEVMRYTLVDKSGPISGMGVVLSVCCVIICSLMQLLHGHTLKITALLSTNTRVLCVYV